MSCSCYPGHFPSACLSGTHSGKGAASHPLCTTPHTTPAWCLHCGIYLSVGMSPRQQLGGLPISAIPLWACFLMGGKPLLHCLLLLIHAGYHAQWQGPADEEKFLVAGLWGTGTKCAQDRAAKQILQTRTGAPQVCSLLLPWFLVKSCLWSAWASSLHLARWLFFFETDSHDVAVLRHAVLLPQPPKCWDYGCVPLCPARWHSFWY
jgi:hypothetical protein